MRKKQTLASICMGLASMLKQQIECHRFLSGPLLFGGQKLGILWVGSGQLRLDSVEYSCMWWLGSD